MKWAPPGADGRTAALPNGSIVRFQTKSDAAYAEIRARVLRGDLAPGSSIDQEKVAVALGISTTPLREALRRLEAEGWLDASAHREIRVSPLSVTELNELYQTRFELDPLAAALACDHVTDDQITELRQLAKEPQRATALEQLDTNRLLHRRIYAAGGNTVLTQILDQLWDRCDRYRYLLIRDDETVNVDASVEHLEIIDALAARSKRRIRTLMRRHLEGSLVKCHRLMGG